MGFGLAASSILRDFFRSPLVAEGWPFLGHVGLVDHREAERRIGD
jgi:hypothetical protein